VFDELFLHSVDDLSGLVHIFFLAGDYQIGLPSSDLYAKGLTQKPKVAVGGAKQLKLFVS